MRSLPICRQIIFAQHPHSRRVVGEVDLGHPLYLNPPGPTSFANDRTDKSAHQRQNGEHIWPVSLIIVHSIQSHPRQFRLWFKLPPIVHCARVFEPSSPYTRTEPTAHFLFYLDRNPIIPIIYFCQVSHFPTNYLHFCTSNLTNLLLSIGSSQRQPEAKPFDTHPLFSFSCFDILRSPNNGKWYLNF